MNLVSQHCNTAISRTIAAAAVIVVAALAAPANAIDGRDVQVASSVGGPIARSEVLSRAKYWVKKRVPYSMNKTYPDPQGRRYRTDCSGFVSMALHLGVSASTVSLPGYMTAIRWSSLRPGDVVGTLGAGTAGANGHVVLFNGWANAAHTKFNTLEEKGGPDQAHSGALANTRDINFKVGTHVAKPYRYKKITG